MRRVAFVQPGVDEEGLRPVRFDKGGGVSSRRVQVRRFPACTPVEDAGFIVTIRLGFRCAFGIAIGQVPLAKMGGAIARLFEQTRQHVSLRVQPVRHATLVILFRCREVLMHRKPRRIEPSHHRRATRRAHGIQHIELLKVCALAGQLIKVGRLQPGAAMAGEIAPAPVVGIDKDDVGLRCFCRVRLVPWQEQQGGKEREGVFHRVGKNWKV